MTSRGIGEARERHFFSFVERIEERIELSLIRMIRDISRIEQLHRQIAPGMLVRFQFHRVKLVIEQAAFAAYEMSMEIIRLQTIHNRRALADRAIFEFQNRHTRRGVLVRRKNLVARFGVIARDLGHISAHAKQ